MTAAWKTNKTVGGVLALFVFIYTTVVFSVVCDASFAANVAVCCCYLSCVVAADCTVVELFCPRS